LTSEHHVEDDFDPVAVQFLDQVLELVHLHAQRPGGGVTGLGGKKPHRAVAPIVVHRLAGDRIGAAILEFVELEDGHQFDTVHSQFLEIGNLGHEAGIGAGMLDLGRGVTGKAARV